MKFDWIGMRRIMKKRYLQLCEERREGGEFYNDNDDNRIIVINVGI